MRVGVPLDDDVSLIQACGDRDAHGFDSESQQHRYVWPEMFT